MIFVEHSDIIRYFLDIVIFYCANTTAFPVWLENFGSGRYIELSCKMGRCLKNVEKPLVLGLHLGVTFTD